MDSYGQAKKEKIKELRKLMHEMMLDGDGDEEMESDELAEALEDAGEESEEFALEDGEVSEDEGEEEESEMSRLTREYFKPKPKASRPGTASIIIRSEAPKKQTLSDKLPGKQFGKKSKYA